MRSQLQDGQLRIPASHIKMNLMGTYIVLDADAIGTIVGTFGPGGTNACHECNQMLWGTRPSLARHQFGVPLDYVWIDETGSEECPANRLGFHAAPGEPLAT